MAEACKSFGYTGDIGYQTFLYSSEQEIRNILIFLTEKLPQDDANRDEVGFDDDKEEEHDGFCNCSKCYPDNDIMLAVNLLPKETRI